MATSTLREGLETVLRDFAWDEWAQMGVLAASERHSPWAQDPEALLLLTLEVARDDPRLFDEVLDWLVRNEPLVSGRRLRTLCDGPEDERLAAAALECVARQRRPKASPRRSDEAAASEPEPLFRGSALPVREPDPSFLAHGFIRPIFEPSGKSRAPDLTAPINFAFRLRHLLGVSARAEAARFLLTAGVPRATVAAVAASAGYAKRNVQEALASLHSAGAASVVIVGSEQRFGLDRERWASLLGLDPDELPIHRDWPQLLGALRRILRWLQRPEVAELSPYLRGSQARDLLDEVRPTLGRAGVVTSGRRHGEEAWDDLVETIEEALRALGRATHREARAGHFEVYADARGGYRWRLAAADGAIIATSGESFASRDAARRAARGASQLAASAIDRAGSGPGARVEG